MARHGILWLLALLLPATTTAQTATTDTMRWRHVGRSGKAVLEFDARSIVPVTHEPNQYEVWVRLTYDAAQYDRAAKGHL